MSVVMPPDKRPMTAFSKSKRGKRLSKQQLIKKRKNRRNMILGGICFFILIVWWGLQPQRGGMEFGICRTFAELQEAYPTTMQMKSVENFDQALRLYYTVIDPFGNQQSKMVECVLVPDAQLGYYMESASFNRKPFEDQAYLDRFSLSIPSIIAAEPDLVIPPRYGDNLMDLKTN